MVKMPYSGFSPYELQLTSNVRLNDKLKARSLSIEDLVTDLSDGVCPTSAPLTNFELLIAY